MAPSSTDLDAEVDDVLEGLEYDAEGKQLIIELIMAFEKRFGFTPSRRDFIAYLAEADNIAAQHQTYLDATD